MSSLSRTVRRASGLHVPAPSGGGFNLTNVNATLNASGGPGTAVMGGKSWTFNSSNSAYLYAEDPAVIDAIQNSFTVAMWLKLDPSIGDDYQNFWAKGNIAIQARTSQSVLSKLRFDMRDGSEDAANHVITGTDLVPGNWELTFCYFDFSVGYMYVDTASDGTVVNRVSGARSGPWNTSDPYRWSIGAQQNTDFTMRRFANMDAIPPVIFDRILTTGEKASFYSSKDTNYETTVLAMGPAHFVNEPDGLTDTLGV